MKSFSRLPVLAAFFLTFVLTSPPAFARLGDDRATLEKRFGKGEHLQQDKLVDTGLWELFDEVISFEKSGLRIVAGFADNKCLAIAYQIPPSKKGEDQEKIFISWTEAQTLVAKNSGEDPITRKTFRDSRHDWEIGERAAFARLETRRPASKEFVSISLFSNVIFDTFEAFQSGDVKREFLQQNPPKDLSDF